MTDREMMAAVYAAIETMYYEMTGKSLKVEVPLENGNFIVIQSVLGDRAALASVERAS